MLRRFSGLCLALSLIVATIPPALPLSIAAQDASPIALTGDEPDETGESAPGDPLSSHGDDPVESAEEPGNTPGNATNVLVFPLPSVYVRFGITESGGNTTALDLSPGQISSLPTGYRSDNARFIQIETTATYQYNLLVCVIYDATAFSTPKSVDLLWLDGSSWSRITDPGNSDAFSATICGYVPTLGLFAAAEPGSNPTAIPAGTETPIPSETPAETSTPTHTETPYPTSTSTPSPTDIPTHTETPIPSPTATETPSSTATPTPSDTPTSTNTSTPTPNPTDTLTATPTSTNTSSPTPTASDTPSATATSTSTSSPTPTASDTPSPIPSATATPTASQTTTSTPSATPIPTWTETPTASPTATPTPTSTESPTPTPTETPTPTPATGQTQFALPNVWVIFSEPPASGTTSGAVLDGGTLPQLPVPWRAETAWFFSVNTQVALMTPKQLCVLFPATDFVDPATVALLRLDGAAWVSLSGRILTDLDDTQGTICGYTPTLGDFALVERLPSTPSPTSTPSATPTPTRTPTSLPSSTPTSTPSPTITPSTSPTATPTASPTPSQTATALPTSTPSATSTPSPSPTPTPTLAPGSYFPDTVLRATTGVHLRRAASTSAASLGVIPKGALVVVTGASVFAGGRFWIPATVATLGSGWIAGEYLTPVATATPTRSPTPTAIPSPTGIGSAPNATSTRPPGGFLAGDFVRTTASLNLRSGPATSRQIISVLPSKTIGQITGDGVRSGSNVFYPVLFDGRPAGFVAGEYLQLVSATPTPSRTVSPTPTLAGVPIRFTTANLNMRTGPGTGYKIKATLPKGTRVSLTGPSQRSGGFDWYPVAINGIGTGWVAGKYLALNGPI